MLPRLIVGVLAGISFLFSVCSHSFAQGHGFYIAGYGGLNLAEEMPLGTVDGELSIGFIGNGGLGYEFGNGLRAEGLFGYGTHDIDKIGSNSAASGDVDIYTFMANILYEFRPDGWFIYPYLGAGVGALRLQADNVAPVAGSSVDEADLSIAIQAIVGASVDITDRLSFSIDYRHLRAPDLTFNTAAGGQVFSDYASHQIMAGLRFRFFSPGPRRQARSMDPEPRKPVMREPSAAPEPLIAKKAPEPQPVAPPPVVEAAPRTFTVYFGSNSSLLTPKARGVIREAAAAARQSGNGRLVLVGHTDSSGSSKYNDWLADRRVKRVRGSLSRLGIAREMLETASVGESDPMVSTGDGVSEGRNRRVEIQLQ